VTTLVEVVVDRGMNRDEFQKRCHAPEFGHPQRLRAATAGLKPFCSDNAINFSKNENQNRSSIV
jgi:hypothetical protein